MASDYFKLRTDDFPERQQLLDEVEERFGERIDKNSRTAAVLEALKAGLAKLDDIEEWEEEVEREKSEYPGELRPNV